MNEITSTVATVAVAIIGVATLAVLVSKNAQTATVIESAGRAFSGALGVAVSPVMTGGGIGSGLAGGFLP
jgi:hypothetical protein